MNIESIFVRSDDTQTIADIVRGRLTAPPDPPHLQDAEPLQSSYDVILAKEAKRKIALSPVQNGWAQILESKEVADFKLAKKCSADLKTLAIVVQIADVVGASGYAVYDRGNVVASYFSDTDDNAAKTVIAVLKENGVPFSIITFRDVIRMRGQGWQIVS